MFGTGTPTLAGVSLGQMLEKAEDKMREGKLRNAKIDDPKKGMWVGKSIVKNRKLSATVTKIVQGIYSVDIRI